jgi:hypothetical protein
MFPKTEHLAVLSNSTGARTQSSKRIGSIAFMLLVSLSAGSQAANASTSGGGYDGPAALPQVLIQTAMANTPAPGITITVNSGENLQAALNNARCGDTIRLQAGATFTGVFTFPNKSCDDAHWIIVRTSSDDSLLPAEGSRLNPCYAGVSSLPGRPAFNCTSTKNVLAKLITNRAGRSGPVVFAPGAGHYRLIGLELTRAAGIGKVYALASPTSGAVSNQIIYDRIWFHGTPHDDTTRGVQLGGSTYVSVIDSFFTDFHCVNRNWSCSDAQAINGGVSRHPMGPYKIVNNFLEASGENILMGGAAATYTPADIEITHNHLFKPLTWMKGQPGYVGGPNGSPFIVKNLFELKNAQRVLLDSNIMENVWGGFSQVGFAILLTPKNQSGRCPICQVTDITVRYNYISHVGAGMQLGNGREPHGALPQDGGRYSIHDDVFDDINGTTYNGSDLFAQVSTGPGVPILHDVTINHVTGFANKSLLLIGDVLSMNGPMSNFVFTNNIVNAGAFPVWSTGTDGSLNCAAHDSPLITLNDCFSSYVFSHNAVVAIPSLAPVSTWPTHNFFPASDAAVEFMNYNGGSGGNYQLQSSSSYKGVGTDGKDLGADVAGLNAAIAGVQ